MSLFWQCCSSLTCDTCAEAPVWGLWDTCSRSLPVLAVGSGLGSQTVVWGGLGTPEGASAALR